MEMGGIGLCCGIINNPQKLVKAKVCGDEEGLIFGVGSSLCSDDGSSEWIWPICLWTFFLVGR